MNNIVRVLVIESTIFGYDGITNVITNYYKYQNHTKIHMDIVTINKVCTGFADELKKHCSQNFILPYRNSNPVRYVYELTKIIKMGKYQIVHVHGCSATMAVEMLAARLAGVKVRIAHSHNTKCDHIKADRILRPFFNKWCNVGFACSKEAGEWMFSEKPFYVITNGIDLEKFQFNKDIRKEIRERNSFDGKFVIGHVGRFSKQKNHEKLIDIFSKTSKSIPNAKLVLIGDGELRTQIQECTQKEKLDVFFVGLSDEVEKWLQAMDMIVFPSLFEGLPLGLVEAQAAGLPCVLSDTISTDIAITDLVKFISLEANTEEWVSAITALHEKFDRFERIDFVKKQIRDAHFDIKTNCVDLCGLYEKLVASVLYH